MTTSSALQLSSTTQEQHKRTYVLQLPQQVQEQPLGNKTKCCFPKAVAGSTGHAGGSSRSGGNCSRSDSREQQQQQQQHQQRERETSQAPCGLVCLWRARNHTRPTRATAPLSLPHQWPHTQLGGLGLGFRDFGTFGCRPVKTGDQSPTTPKIPGFLAKNTRNLENSP